MASNKKSYVPRKNSIVIKVLQQLFLDGSWRGGVREIIFLGGLGRGSFSCTILRVSICFRWWECSHHIQSALTSHYTNKFCKSKVQRILMTFFIYLDIFAKQYIISFQFIQLLSKLAYTLKIVNWNKYFDLHLSWLEYMYKVYTVIE